MTPRPARPAAPRAFTLLEMVLAMVLGVMVIAGAMALFRVLDRSQVRQQTRMDENMEMARAHKVVGLVFQTLLMAQSEVSERDMESRLEEDDARNSEDRADLRDDDADDARLALQPDPALGARMIVATDRGERLAPAQVFGVTIRQSPIAASEGDQTEEQKADADYEKLVYLERALEKTGAGSKAVEDLRRESHGARSSMDSERSGENRSSPGRERSSSSRRSESLGEAGGLLDRAIRGEGRRESRSDDEPRDPDNLSASERIEERQLSRPRAPGVRGVFEILPDDQEPRASPALAPSEFAVGAEGPTYSLWWRELPPRPADEDLTAEGVDIGDEPAADESATAERARLRREKADAELVSLSNGDELTGKRERLLSGCKSIHWTALRGKKPRDKIIALYDKELPGYVELEFETATGRREKWMFEVAWVVGAEPGSVLADQPDALDTIAANAGNPSDPNNPNNPENKDHLDPNRQNNPDNPNVTDPNNPNNPNSPLRPKPPPTIKPGQIDNPTIVKPGTKTK